MGLCYLASSLRSRGVIPFILDFAALMPDYSPQQSDELRALLKGFIFSQAKVPRLVGIGPLVTATLCSVHELIETIRDTSQSRASAAQM